MGKFAITVLILTILNSCHCNNTPDLTQLFTESLHETVGSLHSRAKRSADSDFDLSDVQQYNYHSANPHSLNPAINNEMIVLNELATTGINVYAKLLRGGSIRPLQAIQTPLKAPEKFCPFKNNIICNQEFPYRSFDGSCNNLNNSWWGKSGTPFLRWLPADYSDEFKLNEPRIAKDGNELPNPRSLACALNPDRHEIEENLTHMFMQWGQLVNHDISSLSITREDDTDKSVCKTCTRTQKCLPMMIESNTTCNCPKTMKHSCIEFTRSSASFGDVECTLGPREQVNMQTAFLDGSMIYGTSSLENAKLREGKKGLMKVQTRTNNPNNDLLPASQEKNPSGCLDFRPETKCFVGGDDRINQNPGLMSMQTIMVREHNRIARELSRINPNWGDETIFEETRRVVIAQIQHITYNEYLPVLLGEENMKFFSLNSGNGATKIKTYDPLVDPRISNDYASAAGRFGHSMIRTEYSRLDKDYNSNAKGFFLSNSYFRANDLYNSDEGGLESIVRGLLIDPLMAVDRWFSSGLTQHLFETKNRLKQPFHFDLVAININRGRDHGLSGYTVYREFCSLEAVRTWEDMNRFIEPETVDILRQFYRVPQDVDLFVGAVSENKEAGRLVGPLLSCLLGIQFQGLKFGDRFWYETSESPADFSMAQLSEIRKTSLAKLLCRNMNDTPKIQPKAFLSMKNKDLSNTLVDCNTLPDINWKFWTA